MCYKIARGQILQLLQILIYHFRFDAQLPLNRCDRSTGKPLCRLLAQFGLYEQKEYIRDEFYDFELFLLVYPDPRTPKQADHAEAEPFLSFGNIFRGIIPDRVLITRTRTISTEFFTLARTRRRIVVLAGLQKIFCISRGLVRMNVTSTTRSFP